MQIWRSTSPATLGRLLTLMAEQRRKTSPQKDRSMGFDNRPRIDSPEALFRISAALEREAAGQYARCAHILRCQGDLEMAALFDRLGALETAHLHQIETWARQAGADAQPLPAFRWDPIEGPPPHLHGITPQRALAHALANEERAYAFYHDIATDASDAQVRTLAKQLAREELEHVLLLHEELRRPETPAFTSCALDLGGWHAFAVQVEMDCGRRSQSAAQQAHRWHHQDLAALFQSLTKEAEATLRRLGRPTVFSGSGAITAASPAHLLRAEEERLRTTLDRVQDLGSQARAAVAAQTTQTAASLAGRLARVRDAGCRLRCSA